MPSPSSATDWVASLSPWPEEFGLERMHALLAELGDPQQAFPAIHVVGTNGKSTTTRMTAALLRAEGLRVGAYTSPHVVGWHERLDTDPAGFERAVARVRAAAEQAGATQFEALTAAALAEFAEPTGWTRPSSRPGWAAGWTRRTSSARRLSSSPTSASSTPSVLGETQGGDRGGEARGRPDGRRGRPLRARVAGARPLVGRGDGRAHRPEQPRPRRRRRRDVPGPPGRPLRGRGGHAPRTARASRGGAARDLGRRPQPRRARLPATAAAGPQLRGRRLDSARQGRRRDARRSLGARGYAGGDGVDELPGAHRRRTCNACQAMVPKNGDGAGSRRGRSPAPGRSRAPRARSWSRGRCTCWPTSRRVRSTYHPGEDRA